MRYPLMMFPANRRLVDKPESKLHIIPPEVQASLSIRSRMVSLRNKYWVCTAEFQIAVDAKHDIVIE